MGYCRNCRAQIKGAAALMFFSLLLKVNKRL